MSGFDRYVAAKLQTTAKDIVGAINEVHNGMGGITAAQAFDICHPVFSYIHTDDSRNPADYIAGGAGTYWALVTPGRGLVSKRDTDYAGAEFGSADAVVPYHDHSMLGHTHTVAAVASGGQSANHTHGTQGYIHVNTASQSYSHYIGQAAWNFESLQQLPTAIESSTHTHIVPAHSTQAPSAPNTSFAGASGNTTNANYQPSRATYIWQRLG